MNTTIAARKFIEEGGVDSMLERLRSAGWLPHHTKDSDFAACLPALILALNIPIELTRLCEALPYKAEHIGRVDVLNTLAHLGYIARPARVRLCDLDERLLPCLFIPEKNGAEQQHAMVIIHKTIAAEIGSELSIFYGGNEKTLAVDAGNTTRGTAYFFAKEEDVEDAISQTMRSAADFSWFRALLERFRGIFWQVFALSVVLGMVSLAAPLFVMLVYDRVINAHSLETLSPLIVGAGLALMTEWGLRGLRSRSLAWFSARLDNIVSNKIFEQLMLMPPIFTERAAVASQIARLKAFETVRDFFTGPLFLAMVELPFTLIILLTIALIAGPVAFVPVITAGLYIALLAWMRPKLKTAIKLAARASSSRLQMTVESFEKMHALRASGMTSSWFRQFRDHSGKASLAGFHSNYLASVIETIAHGLFILAGMATIVWSIERIWAGSMTTGALIASMILVWRVLGPFQTFCTSLPRFEQLQNAVGQVNRMVTIQTERNLDEVKARVSELKGHVTFSKVGLRYTKDADPVFAGLSFDAKPGQMVAVTGGNGSGKSTILKLVNGLYRPQAGTVRIDGVDIRQLDAIDLRQHIAYVPQSPHFFQGTISENLRFSEPLASDEMLKTALHQVDAWTDVCALPRGLDTMMGKNHIGLPTALSYRLNLARAYIKNTPLMLFDELPYALLNSSAGEAFHRIIEEWKGHRTIVMVTHREDYLKMADIAVLLRSGDAPVVSDPDKLIAKINKSNKVA